MHIAYLANARIPTEKAHGIQIVKMCGALAGLGHRVTLVAPRRRNPITEDAFTYWNIERNFKIAYLPTIDIAPARAFGFVIGRCAVTVSSWIWLVRNRTARVISREPALLLLPVILGRPVVWEVHGEQWGIAARFVSRRARIVAITHSLKGWLVTKGVPEDRIAVLHDAVAPEDFEKMPSKLEARATLQLPLEARIAVYIGHLYAWKGVPALIEAAKIMPGVTLLIVGGTDRDIKTVRAAAADVRNAVFAGRVPHADVPRYLAAADVAVLPNAKAKEGKEQHTSPLKLFEYMASGVPVVASRLPSIEEVLTQDLGTLVEPGAPAALAEGIRWVLSHSAEAARKAAAAREVVLREHTWHNRAQALARLLA